MLDDVFSPDGLIHATLPGYGTAPEQEKPRPKVRSKSRHEFAYPRLTEEQVAIKHIRLSPGNVVQVREASSSAFLKWYLCQLQFITPNPNSYVHTCQFLLKGISTTKIDMVARWYLLEEIRHLSCYSRSGVKLFVDDETGVA
jgi:hypothetical protein